MRNRILSIALASSLLAAAFVALSTSAAIPYTGSVTTSDNVGAPENLFFVGEWVDVNVEMKQDNVPVSVYVTVSLVQTSNNAELTHYHVWTNDPDVGWNNGSHNGNGFGTGYGFTGDLMVYNVVVFYGGDEIARTSYTVKQTGLTLSPPEEPPAPSYYPGEKVTVTYITTHTTDMFYTQVIDATTGATMVNWTPQIAASGYISWEWQIASDFPDGHFHMNVRDSSTHAIWETAQIYVQKYRFEVTTDRNNYLLGENASMRYTVLDQASMTPFSNIVVSYSAHWVDSVGNGTWQNDTLATSSGTHVFTIPTSANISHDVDITYWANETGTSRSATAGILLGIEQLLGKVQVDSATYMPGDMVTATVTAMAGASLLPGAAVDLTVEKNGTLIATYGAAGLSTDQAGIAVHSFTLDGAAAQGTYVVNVTISKVGFSIVRMTVFTVEWDGELTIALDKAYYYGGDEVQMSFRIIWNNQEISTGSIAYKVTASFGIMATGNTSTREASFQVPQDYSGSLEIEAQANKDGYVLASSVITSVHLADLVLTSEADTYNQGDTIKFHYQVITSLSSVQLAYSIVDADGVEVASGEPTGGSFSYDVPDAQASEHYDATLTLTTPTGAFVTASVTVSITGNYQLTIWVGKSGYASGQFKPGQTLKVHYSIDTHSFAQLPVYEIRVSLSGDPVEHSFFVTESQGVVEVKLPKEGSPAYVNLEVELRDPVADAHKSWGYSSVSVNSNLGAWDRSVGGMRAIDFTLLVLVILIILLLIVVPFLKGRMGGPKAAPAPPTAEPPKP